MKLTVTSNYDVSGMGKYLAIYDQSAGSLVNACYPQGTTCTATTVPLRSQSTYIATFATYSGTYPPSNIVATSNTVTPPAWAVMLNRAGSGFTAVANYDVSGSSRYLGIYNSSTGSLVNACGTGTQCSATVSNTSQLYVATVGNYSSTFAPNPLLAVSVQTGLQGPTGPYETSGGPNPAELSQCFTCAGDPVNTSNGEFFENVTDVSVAGRGPGLVSSRSFSSQRASFDGPLGLGWSFNYNMSVALNSSGTVDVHQENGSMVTFTPDTNGAYHAPARVLASLVHNPDGSWTYIRRARDIFAFNSTGQLSQLSDLNGNTTTLTRNGSGQLTTATDGAGRSLGYSYDANGKIASVTALAGRVTTYGRDAAGRLTSVTAPGGAVTSYTYDASNLLTSVTDPRGSVTVDNYDQAQRVIKQTTAAGDLLLAYGVDGSDAQTTITSPGGRVTKETYRSGQMIKRVAGAGTAQQATWAYTYDQNTFGTASVTDPLGHVTTATYDGSGNRLTGVDPANHQSSWTYNALNEVITATDPAGTTTTYTYNTAGDPLSISTPLTGTSQTATTTYAHTDTAHPGDVTAITDPNGHTTTLTHTATGTLASSTDPLGNATSFTYDTLDRRLTTVSPRGNTTGYGYDAAGHLSTVTDPLNHTTTYTYDVDGNRTAVTDALGHTTVTAYDALNRPTTVTSPDSTVATTAYDADGNKTNQTDALGHAYTYTYDALNRLTQSTDPLGRATGYVYDAAGHPVTLTDPTGRTTTNTYDVAGNRTGTSYSGGATPNTTFTYTATGQRATMTDGTGTTAKSYDSLGRLACVTNGAGQATGYTYDLAGHLTALAYPNGQTVTRTYDAAGHLTGITDWIGHTTTFTPDADGNTTSTIYGSGVTAAATIDAAGQVSAITDTGPGSTGLASFTYTRNNVGALASAAITGITQPAESYSYTSRDQLAAVNTATYTYDPAGNATGVASGATLAYDAASQATSYTISGTTSAITYDTQGNRLTGPAPNGATATYTWDQANRLTGANGTSFAYNADGLRTTRTPATGTVQHYAWDTLAGVPLMLSHGTTSYVYDDTGNPIEHIDAAGAAIYYQHDQYGSTRLLTDQGGTVAATYTYDANGNLTQKTGTADTPLRWNGQAQDNDTGLYYLRARYYDPVAAQFLSVDPLASITKSIYVYADNNPLNREDISGLASMGWCGVGLAGFFAGVLGQACLVVAIDDRDGNVTIGTTETVGLGMQTPAATADLSMQASSARSVDQLGGTFGYGGLTADAVVNAGVGIFGGKCSDAPGGIVLGGDFNLGVGAAPLVEVHMGASKTFTQTFLNFNPFKVFK